MRVLKFQSFVSLIFCGFVIQLAPAQVIEVRPVRRGGEIFTRALGKARLLEPVKVVTPSEFAASFPDRVGILVEYDTQEVLVARYWLATGRVEPDSRASESNPTVGGGSDLQAASARAGGGGRASESPPTVRSRSDLATATAQGNRGGRASESPPTVGGRSDVQTASAQAGGGGRASESPPTGAKIRAELYHTANFVSSYGLYSLDRPLGGETALSGGLLWTSNTAVGVWKGEYYLRISVQEPAADERLGELLAEMATMVSHSLEVRRYEVPSVVRALPNSGIVEGSQRFVAGPQALACFSGYDNPNDLWLLTGEGSEAAIADYRIGSKVAHLLLAEYHTPQLAQQAYQRISQYYHALPPRVREERLLKRKGNYIIGAFDVADKSAMQPVVDQIRYRRIVQWLKPEIAPALPEEPAFPVIKFYLTAFAFIGLMLVLTLIAGALLGGLIFFHRRRRMRRQPGFTDAGGMMRLNLDNLMLPPIDRPTKQLTG